VKTGIFPLSIKLVLEHVASFLPRVQYNTTWLPFWWTSDKLRD